MYLLICDAICGAIARSKQIGFMSVTSLITLFASSRQFASSLILKLLIIDVPLAIGLSPATNLFLFTKICLIFYVI